MIEWVTGVVAAGGWPGVLALMFLENLFPPIPSELIMPLAGFAAARGQMSFTLAVLAGIAGTLLGNAFWYETARAIGSARIRPLFARYGRWFAVDDKDFDKAERTLRKYGPVALFFGRLLPGIRTVISIPAGFALIPRHVFYVWTGLGSTVWIGFLTTTPATSPPVTKFREELRRLGQVEGQTFRFEGRFAAGRLDQLPAMAVELASMQPDLMVVIGAVTVRAVRQATTSIPIVFTVVLDPVADGLVPNAERPGGNTTGVTMFDAAQPRAQMRLLKEVVPGLERVAILGDAGVPDLLDGANREAAQAEGLRPQNIRLGGPNEDIGRVFATIREERAGALLGLPVPAFTTHGARLMQMAAAARIPTMAHAEAMPVGPMIAFGSSLVAAAGRMAGMVDRVLKGARPGDMPIEVETRHLLAVNLRVAREVGVTVPPSILARADQVIE